MRHAEHHAKNRTSLCGLDQETLDRPRIILLSDIFTLFDYTQGKSKHLTRSLKSF